MSIWKRPEELVLAILALLWVVLTYFLAAYAVQANVKYVLLITGCTTLWAVLAFVLWQRNRWVAFWPVLAGLWVACWWPWLDWFALRGVVLPESGAMGLIVLNKPWYATWTFKIVLALLPVVGLYVWKWRTHRTRQLNGLF